MLLKYSLKLVSKTQLFYDKNHF